jgi:hypothetical protein
MDEIELIRELRADLPEARPDARDAARAALVDRFEDSSPGTGTALPARRGRSLRMRLAGLGASAVALAAALLVVAGTGGGTGGAPTPAFGAELARLAKASPVVLLSSSHGAGKGVVSLRANTGSGGGRGVWDCTELPCDEVSLAEARATGIVPSSFEKGALPKVYKLAIRSRSLDAARGRFEAVAGKNPAGRLERQHQAALKSHAAKRRATASETCASPGSDPRTCTTPPSEAPPFTQPLSAADGARLARTGSITLPVQVSGPGTISAIGEVSYGDETINVKGTAPDGSSEWIPVPKNSKIAIEPASVSAEGAGTVELTLTLTAAVKAELAAGKHEELILEIRSSGSAASLAMVVPLAVD